MQINLTGHLTLVTGATGQLGRVIARTLGDCGSDVVVQYLKNARKASELVKELQAKGVRALAVQADVTNQASVQMMKDAKNFVRARRS